MSAAPPWEDRVRWFELPAGNHTVSVLKRAVASAHTIYDFAGSSGAAASNLDPVGSLDANCKTQLEFLEACDHAGNRPHVIFPSSWLVYGSMDGTPVNEAHPVAPRSIYAAHKLCIENYLQIYAARHVITYTICRISNPYGFDNGPRSQNYKVLNSFIQHALDGTPIPLFGDGRQLRDFIYITDLIDALIACGREPAARNDIFNISSGRSYSLVGAVEKVRELIATTRVLFKPWPEEFRTVESGDYLADVSKARRLLGFSSETDLREGLAETLARYREYEALDLARSAVSSAKAAG